MNQNEVRERLISGNKRFQANKNTAHQRLDNKKSLLQGQKPFAAILCCSDSRVPPEYIFDCALGELFVIRVAGNVATPETVASLEYAVSVLNTGVLVVLGHEKCGAVSAALDKVRLSPNLNQLIHHIEIGLEKVNDEKNPVKNNVKYVSQKITKDSEILAEAQNSNQVSILKAYYNLESGHVDFI